MDFSWVAQDDSNAIQNALLTTTGDTIYASGASTPARLGIGSTGQVLTVAGGVPSWATPAAGASGINPNLCINGAFIINQRNYVSAASLASGAYGLDRWKASTASTSLTFTANPNDTQVTISSGGSIEQIVERANVPAGTYTLSWSGTATGRVYNTGATPPSYAASPVTFTADGLANVEIEFTASGGTRTLSLVKFERGSSATTYSLAGNTYQGELSACQRYYWRSSGNAANSPYAQGIAASTTDFQAMCQYPVQMRVAPTSVDFSTLGLSDGVSAPVAVTALTLANAGTFATLLNTNVASGLTQYRYYQLINNNNTAGYLGLSAEL
jgi:hypothetical protein